MNFKFKNRIALYNTFAVAVITALVFIVIYAVVHNTAYAHLDSDIVLEQQEVFNNLDWRQDSIIINKMPEWDEAEHTEIEVNPTFLQIVNTNGKVIFRSRNLLKDGFLYNPNLVEKIFFNDEINAQKIRIGQFPIPNENGKIIGQLSIAISREESYTILNNLLLTLMLAFPVVLLVLFFASSIAASQAIEPVHRLIRTTSAISDSTIDTRLVLPARRDELYTLTQTINELLARIERSMMQQKQFTSDASHEIRTPLAAIRGTLEVLIRKQRDPAAYEEKIKAIILQVDRLDDLLEQLLQLARIESGISKANRESVELSKVLWSVAEKWKDLALAKNIQFHFQIEEHIVVDGDRMLLEVMLSNLVNNAIKYGRENGNIFFSWNEKLNTLSIRDDGFGINKEHLPNIFDRFFRADEARSSAVKGSGLGLSIVKKLADLQNITLTAESHPGIGSTFMLHFIA